MPSDPEAAIKAVVAAVQSGRLTRQRIQESVVKILSAKEKVGLDRKRFVDLEAIGDIVDSPEANEKAQEIADRAVTLVRNNGGHDSAGRARQGLLHGDVGKQLLATGGQAFVPQLRKRYPQTRRHGRPQHAHCHRHHRSFHAAEEMDDVIVQAAGMPELRRGCFRLGGREPGLDGLLGELPHAMETIRSAGKPVALVALGNPYLLRNFPNVTAYLATYSTVPPSEMAAVKALFGRDRIRWASAGHHSRNGEIPRRH